MLPGLRSETRSRLWLAFAILLHCCCGLCASSSAASGPPSSSPAKLEADLRVFVHRNGGFWSPQVSLRSAGESMGRGLFATVRLAANHTFLRLPLTMLLTPHRAAVDFPKVQPISDVDALANYVRMQYLHGHRSAWAAYVNALPSEVPLAFRLPTSELKARLAGRALAETLRQRDRVLARGAQLGDAEEYAKLASVVHSRVFVVRARNPRTGEWVPSPALVPVADMLNLSQSPSTECETDLASTYFECRTTRAVPQDEQLWAPFGTEQGFATRQDRDAYTLMHYGFVFGAAASEGGARPPQSAHGEDL
jgi:hypothetical protein